MSEDYKKEATCPYCQHEMSDSWELHLEDGDQEDVECGQCGKKFIVTANVEVTYNSTKVPCPDGKHSWGEPTHYDISPGDVEAWNKPGAFKHTAGTIWEHKCLECDESESVRVDYKGECPWPRTQEML